LTRRLLGVPLLFAAAYSAVGFSLYFAIGVVADRGLGLTPLIFLAAGVLFVLTTLTYTEGSAMFLERGGSTTMARYAFNELVSFTAGWAILIDYMIVIALAAITVPHYLGPVWDGFTEPAGELIAAGVVIVVVAALNVLGVTGRHRQRLLSVLALADVAIQAAVILVGVAVVFEPELLTAELDPFTSPSLEDVVYAAVLATVAFAGIEAASDLAPDLDFEPADLKRALTAGAILVPLTYAAMAAVALMAVPVVATPQGPETELAGPFIDDPILGVVQSYEPAWLADVMQWAVVAVAPVVLLWAASTSMLGLSRHTYSLATNRQIPSWLGKLGRRHATPHVAIAIAAVLTFGLVVPGDIEFLAGVYAFGALLAISIAHLAVIRLRVTDPDRERPYRVPLDVDVGGSRLPLPAIVAAVITIMAWASVVAFHGGALYLGGGWMVLGLVGYVVYRRVFESTSLTKRVTVPPEALVKEEPDVEYASILVPVFGTKLDDDIVGTAGRLAAAEEPESGDGLGPRLDVVYVIELPLTVPLTGPPPREELERAEAALERAREVGEEYESVEVATEMVRARSAGAGIVALARQRGVEAIVMGGEPPTRVRGGAILGGVGAARPPEIGEVTEYVLRKAPCRVLLTAPPEAEPAPAED
jgi:APA family basic amino acid/polyamine antiporter